MNKYIIFICIFIILNITLIIKNNNINKNYNKALERNIVLTNKLNDIAYYTTKNIKYNNPTTDINKEIDLNIFKFNKNKYKIFYRVDFPYCENCIYPTIELLNELADDIGFDKITIITSFPNIEYGDDFHEFTKKYNLDIINIPESDFCIEKKELIGSYIFTMNKNLNINNIFFCGKNNHFMLNEYFTYLKEYINSN